MAAVRIYWVELGLKKGRLKAVVATSSLDLGVDFLPVERVLQIGSAKGVARLLQRAGRSGHAPGRAPRVTLVPTNTLELVEAAAARSALREGRIQSRRAPERPLDVLVRATPFAFPLMIERLREQVTTEKLGARIERMIADLERAAAA